MTPKKAETKIAKAESNPLAQVMDLGSQLFKSVAAQLSAKLAPEALYTIHGSLDEWEKIAKNLKENAKNRLVEWVQKHGKETTDKGSMVARLPNGTEVGIRPWRTTLDPKKFETMLRAKGLEPNEHMGKKVT